MPGLNQPPHDVEVAEVPNHPDQVDLFPLSAKGVEVVSGYLGCDASVNTPVRMARERYPGFNEFIFNYVKDRGTSFSTGAKPRYRGQRRADQFETDLINNDPAVPRELADHLSCDNKFLVLKDHDFSVLHMRYGAPANGQLYKMTRHKHTPSQSLRLSIGTLSYYQDTVDANEASFTYHRSGGSLRTTDGTEIPLAPGPGRVSFNPCWIYCTTLSDGSAPDGLDDPVWRDDGVEAATPIVCPIDHFAYMLGAAFGLWSKPRIREVYESLHSEESLRATMSPITVVHGPVRYMPAAERNEHLRTLSKQNSPLALHEHLFTKNDEFRWEREYRFGIFGWGQPLKDHVLLPVNHELLACYGPSAPAG